MTFVEDNTLRRADATLEGRVATTKDRQAGGMDQ